MIVDGSRVVLEIDNRGIAEARFDARDAAVNTLDTEALGELRSVVDLLRREPVRGLLFTSAKPTFVVGADIGEFLELFSRPVPAMRAELQATQVLFRDIEDLPFPTVAAINGLALGGGLELCLACDYRVMAEDARVGLPEVRLGIFPGWGGTIRLPRLIGPERAAQLIASGQSVALEEALRIGLADARAPSARVGKVAREWVLATDPGDPVIGVIRARKTGPVPSPAGAGKVLARLRERTAEQHGPHRAAALAALDCIGRHLGSERAAAIDIEVEEFLAVARTPGARHLVQVFLNDRILHRQARRVVRGGEEIRRVLLQCPSGAPLSLAMDLALAGIDVSLAADEDAPPAGELVAAAGERLRRRLRRDPDGARGLAEAITRISALDASMDPHRFDMLVENAAADAGSRPSVLDRLGRLAREDALVATTAWSQPLAELAEFVAGSGRFLGLRTLYVDSECRIAEVAVGSRTAERCGATLARLVESLGRVPVLVRGCAGYLCGRLNAAWLLGFERLLADGVDFRRIDEAMVEAGWRSGPAAFLDRAGTGVAAAIVEALATSYPGRFSSPRTLVMARLASAGRRGRAVSAGFWDYRRDDSGLLMPCDPGPHSSLQPARSGAKTINAAAIIERMQLAMSFEAVRCLEEGIVDDAAIIDAVAVGCCGFPAQLGGPLSYLDQHGAAWACNRARSWQALGQLYWAPVGLTEKAREGGRFLVGG